MKTLLFYLLQVIVASGILYGYYHLALRNKKFHRYNRFYLLAAFVISILVPFINIPVYFTSAATDSSFILQTLTVISSPGSEEVITPVIYAPVVKASWFTWQNLTYIFYALVALLVLIRILFSLKRIRFIIRNNPSEKLENIHFVNTNEPGTPFSFFRWLFWNRKIELQSEKGGQIFRHELFHIQQKHSRDIIFMELLMVIFWINPFFHLLKKEVKAIHEFLADQFAVNESQKWEYAELLLMQALNTNQHLVNPFFHNQIKRRIAMITSSQKPGHQYLRKLMVLPVAAIVVALFAFSYKSQHERKQLSPVDKGITVVIDAGHGMDVTGKHDGAKAADGSYEDDIVLSVAQKIKELNTNDKLKIILTREDKNLVDLHKRIEFANSQNPDLFISLHTNIASGQQKYKKGMDIYISKKNTNYYSENRILANILFNYFSQIHPVNSVQQREAGIYVIDNSNCPSALVEFGYLSNQEDLAFMKDADGQEKIAKSILQSIEQYAMQKESDDWGERKKAVIDTISSRTGNDLNRITYMEFWNAKKRIVAFKADSVVFKSHAENLNKDLRKALLIFNGERKDSSFFSYKLIDAKTITIYPENDPAAIKKYGEDARKGVIVMEGATVKTMPANYIYNKEGGDVSETKTFLLKEGLVIRDKDGRSVYLSDVSVTGQGFNVKDSTRPLEEGMLLVIDGKERPDIRSFDGINRQLDPNDISSINVLKGPSAIAKYGEKGKNGVIEIITKIKKEYPVDQDTIKPKTGDDNKVFDKVEISPSFPGGEAKWRQYLERNLDAAVPVKKKAPDGAYTVVILFIVDKEGNISEVRPLTKHGYGMEDEALRVIKAGPRWVPAMQNGKSVKAYKKQPVTFIVGKGQKNFPPAVKTTGNELNEVVVMDGSTQNTNNKTPYYSIGEWNNSLLVIDGKVIGRLKENLGNAGLVNSVHITVLGSKPATKKYGEQGKDGAWEVYTLKSNAEDYRNDTARGVGTIDRIFDKPEVPPSFPGGDPAWKKYLENNANGLIPVKKGAPAGIYKTYVLFVVLEDGSLDDIRSNTNYGYGIEEEARRLLKSGPKWMPAKQNGHVVRAYAWQPITFAITEEDGTPVSLTGVVLPVENATLKTPFGRYNLGTLPADNPGITLSSKKGSRVRSMQNGIIVAVFTIGNFKALTIREDNYFTIYSGLENLKFTKGQKVKKGDILGEVAANKNYELDFIVMKETKNIDPIPWLKNQ